MSTFMEEYNYSETLNQKQKGIYINFSLENSEGSCIILCK